MKKFEKTKRALSLLALMMALMLTLASCAKSGNKMDGNSGNYPNGNNLNKSPGENEEYLKIVENKEIDVEKESTVTFSLKVDTASYTNTVRYIKSGQLPPADAVRIEELINYFSYDGEIDMGEEPFGTSIEIGPSPLNKDKLMAFVRVKTKDIDKKDMPRNNLTLLIDTSGSMYSYDKLPLLQSAFSLLVENLNENDVVSIVTYAGSAGVSLDSASAAEKSKILAVISDLEAGGSTAGSAGIETAYRLAEKNFIEGGNNRVILATDGDFNVGMSTTQELEDYISGKRDSGIYLSVLGFGTGNIKDNVMETLSKNGNGNYAYINTIRDAEKALVTEMGANLLTVAQDVKTQVIFNKDVVKSYRLIGYENRIMNNEDFEDDTKDAGEIGAGTDVVAMFEFEYLSSGLENFTDPFELNIRYKNPGETESKLYKKAALISNQPAQNSTDFLFASAIAEFGHIIRNSEYKGEANIENVISKSTQNIGEDPGGYRRDFLETANKAKSLIG